MVRNGYLAAAGVTMVNSEQFELLCNPAATTLPDRTAKTRMVKSSAN
jgi:hypothetical protein